MAILDAISIALKNVDKKAEQISGNLWSFDITTNPDPSTWNLTSQLLMYALAAELFVCFFIAVVESGKEAYARGIRAFVWAALMVALIGNNVPAPIIKTLGNTAAASISGYSGNGLLDLATAQYGRAFASIWPALNRLSNNMGNSTATNTPPPPPSCVDQMGNVVC